MWVIGKAGGETLAVAAAETELNVSVADAERAWRSLAGRFDG
jgi:hypothetical protein